MKAFPFTESRKCYMTRESGNMPTFYMKLFFKVNLLTLHSNLKFF
jgi:hypothetical protein